MRIFRIMYPTFIILAAMWSSTVVHSLKAEWIPLSGSPTISPRRSGHTAFSASPNNGPVFVFGGYVEEDPHEEGKPFHRYVQNDLWKWDGTAWIQQKPKGNIPGPRLATATAVVNGNAYLFGGWDPQTAGTGGVILEEIHKLDLETLEWSLVDTVLPDGPASRHVALALPNQSNKIWIHNHRCTDHVWILDPETNQFIQQTTTGESPGSVGLHTAVLLDEDTILVFGGATKDGRMSNQSHVLDLKTWKWTRVELLDGDASNCPSPRAGACLGAHVDGDTKCGILFGGAETTEAGLNPKGDVWALHLAGPGKGRWELLLGDKQSSSDCSRPEPRNAATLTKLDSGSDGCSKFLMTGGWAPFRKTWDDAFILSISR